MKNKSKEQKRKIALKYRASFNDLVKAANISNPTKPLDSGEELRTAVEHWGRDQELLTDGDYAVFVTSSTFGTLGHDELFVHQIED